MSDKFNEAELKGREKFKTFCDNQEWCTLIKFDENKYGSWDVAFLSGETKMIGELKDREYNSTTFDSWICEKEKLERIQAKVKKRKDIKVMYINTFTDDKILFIERIKASKELINKSKRVAGSNSILGIKLSPPVDTFLPTVIIDIEPKRFIRSSEPFIS